MSTRKSSTPSTRSLVEAFSVLPDPRSHRSQRHPLINIVVIAICGVICGADNWVAIETWGKSKKDWLSSFLDMSQGVPSHDTFGRVFSILSSKAFQQAFIAWAEGLEDDLDGKVVAIDGKSIRRSHDRSRMQGPIHMLNAWRTDVGVSLGQVATDRKSNEITAVPELLQALYLKGAIVTLDAMGCQREIASAIRAKEADYLLAVKGNQPKLLRAIEGAFETAFEQDEAPRKLSVCTESEDSHGRSVERTVWSLPAPQSVKDEGLWKDLESIVLVESQRVVGEKSSSERRLYITSLPSASATDLARAVRDHWGVENGLHWVLDVAFREDESRIRTGHATENMARLRQIALNVLKQEKTLKVGIHTKRLRAGWDEAYLLKLLKLLARGA